MKTEGTLEYNLTASMKKMENVSRNGGRALMRSEGKLSKRNRYSGKVFSEV